MSELPTDETAAPSESEDDLALDEQDLTEESEGTPLALPKTSGQTALARHDPLARYMRDVQRYALLSPEEEKELAERYAETGDVEAARALVTSNLRLVVKIAYNYRQAYKNILDLVQEGNIGLMQAVKKYDPYRGVKLSTYAAWWIRAYMLRYILNNHRLVKLGTTQAQRKLFFNLRKEKAKLSAMGIEPTAKAIAKRLDVSEEEVVNMDRRLASGDASLDAPVRTSDGQGAARVELLPGDMDAVDDEAAKNEIREILIDKMRSFGKTLKNKEAAIFNQRLLAEDPKTLQELGDEFGVTRERVRQIEKRLLKKMRTHLGDELEPSVIDIA